MTRKQQPIRPIVTWSEFTAFHTNPESPERQQQNWISEFIMAWVEDRRLREFPVADVFAAFNAEDGEFPLIGNLHVALDKLAGHGWVSVSGPPGSDGYPMDATITVNQWVARSWPIDILEAAQ